MDTVVESADPDANCLLSVLVTVLVETTTVSKGVKQKNKDPDFCFLPHIVDYLVEVI